jgi:hypothetical protein
VRTKKIKLYTKKVKPARMAVATLMGAAAMVAVFDMMSSKGQSLSVTDNITSDMAISATFLSESTCVTSATGDQSIDVTGGDISIDKLTNEDSNCHLCITTLGNIVKAREILDGDAASRNPGYTIPIASESMQALMVGGTSIEQQKAHQKSLSGSSNLGPCTLMCSNAVVSNVQQSQTFTADTSCQVNTSVKSDLSSSINGKISSYLKNQEDISGVLEDAFTSNTESMTNNLSNIMSESVTTKVRQNLLNAAANTQTWKIENKANSVYVNGSTQSFTSNSIATLKVNNEVNNSLRQSADYSISQQLINKNDTIGDMSKDFLQVIQTMSDLVETVTGQVLIIMGAVLAIIAMIGGSMYISNTNFRNYVNGRIEGKYESSKQTSGSFDINTQ